MYIYIHSTAKKGATVKHVTVAPAPGTNKLSILGDQTTIVFPYPDDAGLSALGVYAGSIYP